MQRIEEVCGDLVAVNTNKIYPLLRRLEERGFVTASWDHPTKRSRRVYAITPQGEERLERIKVSMLPYLESIERAIGRLKDRDLPAIGKDRAVPGARPSSWPRVRGLRASARRAGARSFVVDAECQSVDVSSPTSRRKK